MFRKKGSEREQESYPGTAGFKVTSLVLYCSSITLVIIVNILKHS